MLGLLRDHAHAIVMGTPALRRRHDAETCTACRVSARVGRIAAPDIISAFANLPGGPRAGRCPYCFHAWDDHPCREWRKGCGCSRRVAA